MKDVIIIGTGGHAKVIADIVMLSGDNLLGFLTSDTGISEFADRPILGRDTDFSKFKEANFIIAIGNAKTRERISGAMSGVSWYTAIHPTAVVSGLHTEIGEGSAVMANAVINPYVTIGRHCIINSNATVEHDNRISDYAHVSVGAKLAGAVQIGTRTWIGIGASVIQGIEICDDCMVGAGAVVIRNIEQPGTYVGVPACSVKPQ